MKLASLLLGSVLFTASTSAQYFSEGWKPGQPAAGTQEAAAPAYTAGAVPPPAQQGRTGSFDFSKLFTSGPVGSLLAKAGVNFSAVNGTEEIWDPRIPMITDENYDELITNEVLTAEEEKRRAWFLVVTSTVGQQQQGGISKLVDREYDAAYNTSLIEGDLPDVRWGRIDYLNVTYITTKWNLWQAPWLVVATDHGKTLRFYNARHVRLNATVIRTFLKEETWKYSQPWSSALAPGGSREFLLHYFALGMKYFYDMIVRVPKFLLMIMTGGLGSLLMRLMHRQPAAPAAAPGAQQPATPQRKPVEPAQPETPSSPAKKAGGKTKKGGKK